MEPQLDFDGLVAGFVASAVQWWDLISPLSGEISNAVCFSFSNRWQNARHVCFCHFYVAFWSDGGKSGVTSATFVAVWFGPKNQNVGS